MRHVAIIPCRANSKSIPNKNLQKIGNKSLVNLAVEGAKEAAMFHKIVISTDMPTIMEEYAKDLKVEILKRPTNLCEDTSEMSDVIYHAIKNSAVPDSWYVWLLQPTSPFRSLEDFKEIKRVIDKGQPDSLISVVNVGANHPNRMYFIKRNNLFPLRFTNFSNKQDLKPAYLRNGAFYVVNCGAFKRYKKFHLDTCIPYEMPTERSVNIDTWLDLLFAQAVFNARQD